MAGPVSDRREMIAFGKIKNARERTAVTCLQALLQLIIGRAVSVVIDPGAEAAARLDERDLKSRAGQNVCCDTASWPAADNAYIKNLFKHWILRFRSFYTCESVACVPQPQTFRLCPSLTEPLLKSLPVANIAAGLANALAEQNSLNFVSTRSTRFQRRSPTHSEHPDEFQARRPILQHRRCATRWGESHCPLWKFGHPEGRRSLSPPTIERRL